VSTASTKRRNRKKGGAPRATRPEAPTSAREVARPAPEALPAWEVPERAWLVASAVILALAAFLRLYALELKPMHHDEGVNGFFLTNLVRHGSYKYDPTNYHGPTLYYLSVPLVTLFGLSTFAVRLLPALFGVATVWLALALRRQLGTVAALAAAALIAVSPGAVYYSRYYIHETLFVFFTLGIVVAALRFRETGSAWHLMLLALSAALLFATKETHFISVVTLGLAALVASGWERWFRARPARGQGARRVARPAPSESLLSRLGGARGAAALAAGAVVLFLAVNALFYSSFLTNPKGVGDALKALNVWAETGTSDFHEKPAYTYVNWLWQEEAPILILAAVGSAVALFGRASSRFAVFAGAWGFGMLAAYSLIPYKTPWLALSFVVPLALAAGYGVQALGRLPVGGLVGFAAAAVAGAWVVHLLHGSKALTAWAEWAGASTPFPLQAALVVALVAGLTALGLWLARGREGRGSGWGRWGVPPLALGALACGVCLYQSWVLNFREYDNDKYPYVYSHSQRGMLDLIAEIERLSARTGRGKEASINVASRDYWPFPWYFRDYTGVGYHGSVAPRYDAQSTPIVVGREGGAPSDPDYIGKLRPLLMAEYKEVGTYDLRPGVRLVLFARRDLVGG